MEGELNAEMNRLSARKGSRAAAGSGSDHLLDLASGDGLDGDAPVGTAVKAHPLLR